MNWEIRSCLAFVCVLAAASGGTQPKLRFTVLVYNYAAVSPDVLAQTEAEVARVYGHGVIEIVWLDCPLSSGQSGAFPACQPSAGPTWLVLRILPERMAERLSRTTDSLGFALFPDDGSFGRFATAFAHDADQLARRRKIGREIILGEVVAHELGHLLLGPGSHSNSGIMNASWHAKELQIIADKKMLFTPQEVEKMRANLRFRISAEAVAKQTLVSERL